MFFQKSFLFRLFSCLMAFVFAQTSVSYDWLFLKEAKAMQTQYFTQTSSMFSLPLLRGMKINPENPLEFDFLLDLADETTVGKDEASKLVRYFLAVLSTPEEDLWVNLSPYEQDRIIDENVALTEVGQDLLAQDYLLKKLSSSLTYPEEEIGQEFWGEVYQTIYQTHGTYEISSNTFAKVWIVPEKAKVVEFDGGAYVQESRLKVMMQDDYDAIQSKFILNDVESEDQAVSDISSKIAKEIILPEIEREINEGEHFAPLRQIYHSLILAVWFKGKLKNHFVNQVYADQGKLRGIDLNDPEAIQSVYDEYFDTFQKGVYSMIVEDYDPVLQEIKPRKYFSGGMTFFGTDFIETVSSSGKGILSRLKSIGSLFLLTIALFAFSASGVSAQQTDFNTSEATVLSYDRGDVKRGQTNQIKASVRDFDLLADYVQDNPQIIDSFAAQYPGINAADVKSRLGELDDNQYGIIDEIAVTAVQYEFNLTVDGDYGPGTEDALKAKMAMANDFHSTTTYALDVTVDGNDWVSSETTNLDSLVQKKLEEKMVTEGWIDEQTVGEMIADSVNSLQQELYSRDTTLERLEEEIDSLNNTIAKFTLPPVTVTPGTDVSLNNTKTDPLSGGDWSVDLYSDFGFGLGLGAESQMSPFHYGTMSVTYSNSDFVVPFSTSLTLEDGIAWTSSMDSVTFAAAAPYFNLSVPVSDNFSVSYDYRTKGIGYNSARKLSLDYTPLSGDYSLTTSFYNAKVFDELTDRDETQRAFSLEGSASLLGFDISPRIFYYPDSRTSDWGISVSRGIGENTSLSWAWNPSQNVGTYTYYPDVGWRFSANQTFGNVGLGLYLMSNDYSFNSDQLGAGLVLSYSATTANPSDESPDDDLQLPVFNASIYNDTWMGLGQYGTASAGFESGDVSLSGTFETAGAMGDDGVYALDVGLYKELGLALGTGKVSTTLHLGHRANVLGAVMSSTYAGVSLSTEDEAFSTTFIYGNSQAKDSEGIMTDINGAVAYTSFQLSENFSVSPYAVFVTGDGMEKFDVGGSVSFTGLPFGFSATVEKNTWDIYQFYYAENQAVRYNLGIPELSVGNTTVTPSAYYAADDFKGTNGVFGGTVNFEFSNEEEPSSARIEFDDFESTTIAYKIPELPEGFSGSVLAVGDEVSGNDFEMISFLDGFLTQQDFVDHYQSKRLGKRKFKDFQRAMKNIEGQTVTVYTAPIQGAVLVMQRMFQKSGYTSLSGKGDFDDSTRSLIYDLAGDEIFPDQESVSFETGDIGFSQDKASLNRKDELGYGGIDLKSTRDILDLEADPGQLMDRTNPDFFPIINMNAVDFKGFGFEVIQMIPLLNLGKFFADDSGSEVVQDQSDEGEEDSNEFSFDSLIDEKYVKKS